MSEIGKPMNLGKIARLANAGKAIIEAKPLKGWRTMIVGGAISLTGSIQSSPQVLTDMGIPDHWVGVATTLLGIAVMALRGVTDTPVGKKR